MPAQTFMDQMGNLISLPAPPVRIVSLVPSQTELLYDLGLDQEVVGITKFCVHPPHWLKEKIIVGGTKNFDVEKIASLQPDLIIGNKEENTREGILELYRRGHTVWMSDMHSVEDALQMISRIGPLVNREEQATNMVRAIQSKFNTLRPQPSKKVLYLIWRKPWMAAARETFIDAMIGKMGLRNCLEHETRYPELTSDQVASLSPEIVFLSSEPYPFREKHIEELKEIVPSAQVMLVDGEMFSWYGSRMLKAVDYLNGLNV